MVEQRSVLEGLARLPATNLHGWFDTIPSHQPSTPLPVRGEEESVPTIPQAHHPGGPEQPPDFEFYMGVHLFRAVHSGPNTMQRFDSRCKTATVRLGEHPTGPMHILFVTDTPELWHRARVHALLPLVKLPPVLHDPYLLPTTACVLARSIVINGASPTPRELHILLLPLTIDGVVHLYPNDCTPQPPIAAGSTPTP